MSVKWSAFPAGSAISGGDIPVGLQSAANVQWTWSQIATFMWNSPTLVTPTLGVATATSITSPLLIGGTGTTSTLIHKTTTGVGTTNADMIFQVGNNGATEAMRILNNARIGVSTTAPAKLMQIGAGTDAVSLAASEGLVVSNFGSTAIEMINSTDHVNMSFGATSSSAFFGTRTNHPLYFQVNTTNYLGINVSGGLSFGNSTWATDTSVPAQCMAIQGNGNTGLLIGGTAAALVPVAKLDIQGTAATSLAYLNVGGSTTARMIGTVANTGGSLRFGVDNSTGGSFISGSLAYSSIFGSSNSTALHLTTNNAIRATITSGGNFGIGLTNASQLFTVSSAALMAWDNGSGTADVMMGRSAAASLQHGAADAASPVAQTIQVQNVIGTTTNTAGQNWTFNGSVGTGSGAGGQIIKQTAPAGGASRTASSVTCSSASPGVFSLTSHGLAVGQPFTLGGTPPTGYALATTYYVCNDANYGANAFTGSTSLANALAGTAINTSSTGTSVTLTTGQNGLVPALTLTAPATFSNASSRTQIGFPSTIVGYQAALATTATDGFLYIPTCSGTPTGTPTSFTGKVALIYDTSAHQFWIYDGGWKQPKTPAAAAIITWQ